MLTWLSLTNLNSQVRLLVIEHLRMPAYLVASVGFPTLFFLIFAVPEANQAAIANTLLASFLGFAVLGVMFLQFAHGLAEERSSAWYFYLKTLPFTPLSFFISRVITAGLVALLTAATLTVVALLTTPVNLSGEQWLKLYLYLLVGGISFALMGIAMGVWVSEKLALPLGNLIYLPLSYAGGLWKPPELLPQSVQNISRYLPTRAYGDLLWSVIKKEPVTFKCISLMFIWTSLFLLLAWLGQRRGFAGD